MKMLKSIKTTKQSTIAYALFMHNNNKPIKIIKKEILTIKCMYYNKFNNTIIDW